MKKRGLSRITVTLLSCMLAVPTVNAILYHPEGLNDLEWMKPYLAVGLALGVIHLLLRPVLRLITAPLGCLSFGLAGVAVDVGLIYLAAGLTERIPSPGFLCALLTALAVNTLCGLFAR